MRWAETTRASWATPKRSSTSAAWRMVSQSLAEPITTPTSTAPPRGWGRHYSGSGSGNRSSRGTYSGSTSTPVEARTRTTMQ